LPKALWFSNPCTASSFTAPRVMFRWNPNEPIPNGDHSKNRDRAGRCSTSAPTGVAFARSSFFSMQGVQRLDRRAGLRMG
jgi:hypothetical protein